MNSRPLTYGSQDIFELHLRDDQDVQLSGGFLVVEMDGHRFPDVFENFVYGFSLCKNILADAAGTPEIAVVIDLKFEQHKTP